MKSTQFIVDQLKKDKPKAIILFGSAARGEMGKDSDLDILVVKKTNKEYHDRVREVRFSLSTKIPIDVIVLTPKEARELPKKNSFFAQIIKEGKLLYGRL